MITRRDFTAALAAVAGALALPRRAHAIGPGSLFRFGELSFAGLTDARPSALGRLSWELKLRTSVEIARDQNPTPAQLGSEHLFETPFLYLTGDKRFPLPSPKELENLRRFLTYGGFLFIDSAEGRAGGEFDASVRQLTTELFPAPQNATSSTGGFVPLGDDHVIYKSFYLITSVAGRVAVAPQLEAILHDGRAAIVYCQNDLGGAWAKDNFGNYQFQCYPGGENQREQAYRLGINLVMYALCLDYKSDQVHVPFIMKRRKWKADQ